MNPSAVCYHDECELSCALPFEIRKNFLFFIGNFFGKKNLFTSLPIERQEKSQNLGSKPIAFQKLCRKNQAPGTKSSMSPTLFFASAWMFLNPETIIFKIIKTTLIDYTLKRFLGKALSIYGFSFLFSSIFPELTVNSICILYNKKTTCKQTKYFSY